MKALAPCTGLFQMLQGGRGESAWSRRAGVAQVSDSPVTVPGRVWMGLLKFP